VFEVPADPLDLTDHAGGADDLVARRIVARPPHRLALVVADAHLQFEEALPGLLGRGRLTDRRGEPLAIRLLLLCGFPPRLLRMGDSLAFSLLAGPFLVALEQSHGSPLPR
jgi:hypothetical protein